MLFLLFFLTVSEKLPYFRNLFDDGNFLPSMGDIEQVNSKFTRKMFNGDGNMYRPEAWHSNLAVSGCRFVDLLGFGLPLSDGEGGALYAYHSIVEIIDSIFGDNRANNGGAIAAGFTSLFITKGERDSVFANNTAALSGGAIILFHTLKDHDSITIIQNAQFINNSALFTGGAIYVKETEELTLEDCNFSSNTAGHNGGAIMIRGTDEFNAFLSSCVFMENSAGEARKLSLKANHLMYEDNDKYKIEYEGRGCPGLALIKGKLNTQGCIFKFNHQHYPRHTVLGDGIHNTVYYNAHGSSIMLSDVYSWVSNKDCITNYFAYNHNGVAPIIQITNHSDSCGDIVAYQSITTPVPPSNKGDGAVKNIPQPTTFTYQATPITKPMSKQAEYKLVVENKPSTRNYSTIASIPKEKIHATPFPSDIETTFIVTETIVETITTTYSNTKVLTVVNKDGSTTYAEQETTVVIYNTTYTNANAQVATNLKEYQEFLKSQDKTDVVLIVIFVCVGILIIVAAALLLYFRWKKNHEQEAASEETMPVDEPGKTKEDYVKDENSGEGIVEEL